MSNTILNARITDSRIELSNLSLLSSGSDGAVQIMCEFCSLWDGYTKTAVFYRKKKQVYHVLITGGFATIPHEVLADEGTIFFGIMGVKDNTRTTEAVRLEVVQGAITIATAQTDPTPDIYQQLLMSYNNMEHALDFERQRLNQLIAMSPAPGTVEYVINDGIVEGVIRSNGTSAYIEVRATSLNLDQDDYYYCYGVPTHLAPLTPVALTNSVPNEMEVSLYVDENGQLILQYRNLKSAAYEFPYIFASATFPLAVVSIPEVIDARLGANGRTYHTAGDSIRGQVNQMDEKMSAVRKRVTNLEQGIIPSPFETDSGVAYQKSVPTNALPYAEVEKIGGMTRKYEYYKKGDLLANSGSAGFDGDLWDDKVVTVATAYADGVVTFTDGSRVYDAWDYEDSLSTLKVGDLCIFYTDTDGITILCKTELIQELRSAPVTEVESVGVNLFDHASYLKNGKKYSFSVIPSKMLYRNSKIGDSSSWGVYDNSGVLLGTFTTYNFTATNPLRLPSNASYIECTDVALSESLYIGYDSDTTYRPYVKYTLPIPSAVQALDGYGDGVNESVYNYIDWEKKQFVKKLKTLVLKGTEDFVATSHPNRHQLPLYNCLPSLHIRTDVPYVCSHYTAVHYDDRADKTMCMYTGGGDFLQFWDSDFSTVADFKAHLAELYANGNPVIVVYPLVTPEVTDISNLLPEDNFISVEGGGTVTFKNEHVSDVPSEITFQIKGANA